MTTSWQTISGIVQGDISYILRLSNLEQSYADFTLTAFSERWSDFDISLEYKLPTDTEWKHDADIIASNAISIHKNNLFGLQASKYGFINVIRWKFANDNVFVGDSVKIKITVLPTIRSYSTSTMNHIVSQVSHNGFSKFIDSSTNTKIIGINQAGQYICTDGSSVSIRSSPNSNPIYTATGLNNPKHAFQIWNNNYVIVDSGNNQILELNFNLLYIEKTLNVNDPVYADYSEKDDILLVTRKSDGIVEEYTWGNHDGISVEYGEKIWSSDDYALVLYSPECATYKFNDITKLVICDSEKNSIIKYDKNDNTYLSYSSINLPNAVGENEFAIMNEPFRAFWTDSNLYIIEKQGKRLNFNIMESSSSS